MDFFNTSVAFFGVAVLLGLAPGPDNLFVMLQSALRGRRAGMLVVLGLCTGLMVHTAAVALGLAALFAASTVAFNTLKWVGAAYMAYLAWQAFRAPATSLEAAGPAPVSGLRMYARGVIMNLTNPKVVIFFLAFLPQFVEPARGSVGLQVLWLGVVFIAATLLTFCAIAWFSASFALVFQTSPRAQIVLNRLAGTVFIGLALRLAVAER